MADNPNDARRDTIPPVADGGKTSRARGPRNIFGGSSAGGSDSGGGGGSGGSAARSGGSDSRDSAPTGKAGAQTGSPAFVRLDDTEVEAAPVEKQKGAPKKSAVPAKDRVASGKVVAEQLADAANFAALMLTHEPAAIMTGTPDNARPTVPEYERITEAAAAVLGRFDWITKVRTVSDAGTLLTAMGMWAMRVYIIWVMKHPEQGFGFPNPFARRKQEPEQPPQPENGRPPDIDLTSIGFGPVRDIDETIG